MNRTEAPAPGWYPDPVQRARLRWWDGSDWTDHRRVGPRPADLSLGRDHAAGDRPGGRSRSAGAGSSARSSSGTVDVGTMAGAASRAGISRTDASAIVNEVRVATRGELDRATKRLTEQAGDLRAQLEPLLKEYGRRFLRWARRAAVFAVVLYVLYVLATAQLQTSLLEWLGDQVDKVFE